MSKKSSATLIGLFSLLGLVIATVSLVILGAGKFFEKSHTVQLYFEKSVFGLQVGSDVRFGGVRIGRVSSISVIVDSAEDRKVIPVEVVLTEKQLRKISGTGDGMIDFTSRAGIEDAVERGLRAGMKQESLVTGQLYVEFDLVPGAGGYFYQAEIKSEYPVVPTIPTQMDEMISSISDGIQKINELDLNGVIGDIRTVLQGFDTQLDDLDLKRISDNLVGITDEVKGITEDLKLRETAGNLNQALDEWRLLATKVNQGIDPVLADLEELAASANLSLRKIEDAATELKEAGDTRSPVFLHMQELLHELEITSRSVKELSDDLKRNPNTLLRGRKQSR